MHYYITIQIMGFIPFEIPSNGIGWNKVNDHFIGTFTTNSR